MLVVRASRFLRARKFDVPKTKAMFATAEQWRKDFKVDELYETFDYKEREAVNQIYPQFYHKTDKVLPNVLPLCVTFARWLTCCFTGWPSSLY